MWRTALHSMLLLTVLISQISMADTERSLDSILQSRAEALKLRDVHRHPKETVEFFGIQPGMKVAEVSPGAGWYTSILVPLIGPESLIVGLYYSPTMWGQMYDRYTQEMIDERNAHIHDFVPMVSAIDGGARIETAAFHFGGVDSRLYGTLDAVTMIRTLHNIMSVENRGSYLTQALNDVYNLLKPGGIVAVVQHRAPETADDEWANGRWGYVKTSAVIEAFECAGFELVAQSELNANAKDQPVEGDYVWRLPPASQLLESNKHRAGEFQAIGESDRMTLKFAKVKR